MTKEEAVAVAEYLFLHKWLAAEYSPELKEQLVEEILEAAEGE